MCGREHKASPIYLTTLIFTLKLCRVAVLHGCPVRWGKVRGEELTLTDNVAGTDTI